mmetsp:Transcript_5166/g.12730  ORF Transcript_5166/g.12730 Transcript_5166/m.12730 type:complete len:729 (-) Transcript_5166:223-2409(-)|eukprot:CAMPEP_0202859642 /NCGR_PEP_ID=MMETSP1391-20130828/1662_1 /ASSEMBLY_ACC=CAM_ASM_000867 /TAXON_ID=1034604 /ORGANISM="Chlamydomonas leiostraca, Strain SAG 11-49" /LENGTH=728 /DNA_ID=CAMNT_0049538693 /DNA_START=98 /DNA_END=2284 /DNA_ORIENTATION=+
MAPKAKKPKKTKEEIEAERRAAEEAARLAEEERLRQLEEERKRLEELEAARVALLGQLTEEEHARVESELQELEPVLGQQQLERTQAAQAANEAWEWERFLACTYTPHPKDRVAMADYLRGVMGEGGVPGLDNPELGETLRLCQDMYAMLGEAALFRVRARLAGDNEGEATHAKDTSSLHEAVGVRLDRASAEVLFHADEHANDKGEICLGRTAGNDFGWALWVNTAKNPRLKAVELPALHMVVEIPKQVALASAALRVVRRDQDEFFARCSNALMAVGGVLYAELLALPSAAKHVKSWVLRAVTHLSAHVGRIPYPIPPAGADPAVWKSEEEPPPLGFAGPFRQDVVLLGVEEGGPPPLVGWWDPETSSWSTAGVSDVALDRASGSLSFRTTHIGPLAVLQSRAALLPYTWWSIRPTGGRAGATAAIHVGAAVLKEPLVLEVGAGWVSLAPHPQLGVLADMTDVRLPPAALLTRLSQRGLHLMPEDRDAQFAGVALKERSCEEAMCMDLALLGGVFLMARSRWNQDREGAGGAGPGEAIARISEVMDWEAGGRTEQRHVERVFTKEKEDGERRVLAVMRRGTRGVAFCDALDRREAYPVLPGHESVESVQACMDSVWGECHASLLSLLKGVTPKAGNLGGGSSGASAGGAAPPSAPSAGNPPPSAGGAADGGGSGAAGGGAGGVDDSPLTLRLCASAEGMELVRATDPVFTETLGHTMFLLRLFSFS